MSLKKCPNYGNKNLAKAVKCVYCGAELEEVSADNYKNDYDDGFNSERQNANTNNKIILPRRSKNKKIIIVGVIFCLLVTVMVFANHFVKYNEDKEIVLHETEETTLSLDDESSFDTDTYTEDDLTNDRNHQGQFEQDLDTYGDELQQQNDTGNYSKDDEAIWQYCEDRWDYYDNLEGGYSGDKYTNQVFADAASRFGISSDDAYLTWQKVQQEKLGV